MSSVKVTFDDEEEMVIVREQEGRREKVAGTHVIADAKFQRRASRGSRARDLSLTSPGDARSWNLPSAITCVPATFARLLSYLSTINISPTHRSVTSTLLIAQQVSLLIVLDSNISTI